MTREELLYTAQELLQAAKDACLLDPYTLSHPDRYKLAQEVYEIVAEYLRNDIKYPNPSYHGQDEMAAAFIVLASADEDTYRSVVQFCFREFESDISTLNGICYLETICRALKDDHNLCLKTDGPLPTLANEGYFSGFVRGANPASVLEAIRPLAEVAVMPAKPVI